MPRKAGLKAVPTGIDHGTVTVIAGKTPFEVTTLRRDVETFGRHAKIAYTTSWEEDAKRRDFTLNALYAGEDGTLFDPLGGYADLVAGRVRFIGEAEDRIKEDYLRILRFFRLHAYYGKGEMDEAGLHASVKLRAGLAKLSAERVGGELKRLLVAPQAIAGRRGALRLWPSHRTPWRRAAACPLRAADRHRAGERRGGRREPQARRARDIRGRGCAAPRQPLAAVQCRAGGACSWRRKKGHVSRLPDEAAAKSALYRLGPADYRHFVLLAWTDSGAAPDDPAWRQALALPERWQAPAFPLGGHELMALGASKGPDLGQVLKRLEQDWIDSGFNLDREQLLAKARTLIAELA